jgi:putative membrane protein
MEHSKKSPLHWNIVLKGAAMGIAEIIPGVSGGTIAFITGIYERLMASIKSFDLEAVRVLAQKGGVSTFWQKIDGWFLCLLFGGMITGLVAGAFGVTWIIEYYPLHLWGFFFGLIFASFFMIIADIKTWNIAFFIWVIAGTVIAYFITELSPLEPNMALWYVGLSGMLAITALMLPGISGSFILLILGMYTYILPTFKNFISTFDLASLIILAVFGIGCLVGVLGFSRIISFTFLNYRRPTLALMGGFVLGSLNKIWPWRESVTFMSKDGELITAFDASNFEEGSLKLIEELKVLPWDYSKEPFTVAVIFCFLLGVSTVYLLSKLDHKQPN